MAPNVGLNCQYRPQLRFWGNISLFTSLGARFQRHLAVDPYLVRNGLREALQGIKGERKLPRLDWMDDALAKFDVPGYLARLIKNYFFVHTASAVQHSFL